MCNGYFSTPRAATDKQSSSVERVGQVAKGWSLKQRLGPLKPRNNFHENPLVSGYCHFPDNSLKWFLALKNYSLKSLNIPARTHCQALEMGFFVCPQCQNLHTKSLINLQECLFQPTCLFSSVSNILLLGRQIFKSLKTNV